MLVGNKLVIIVADGETLVGWSIINLMLKMELVHSLELGNLIILGQINQSRDSVAVGDWISLQ